MFRRLNAVLRPDDARTVQDGFTIAEVMVAMMVFAIMSVGIAAGIINALVLTSDGKARTIAVQLASQALDLERGKTDIFTVVSKTTQQTVGNITFTIAETANWADANGSVNACGLTGQTSAIANKSVDIQVTWRSRSNVSQANPVRMTALVPPGTDSSSPDSGTIFVGVTNAGGTGSAGVKVAIAVNSTAPNGAAALPTQPAVTTTSGCSIARGVTPGNYVVTISRSGGVDYQQRSTPTSAVTVTGGGTATASFQYDTAATYTPFFKVDGAKLPTNLALTYRTAAGDFPISSTGAVQLFPFTDGYRVMSGSYVGAPAATACTDVDPSSWKKGADGKVGLAMPTVSLQPGDVVTRSSGSADADKVMMGSFTVTTGVGAVTVTATPTTVLDPGDPGCNTTPKTTYTFTSSAVALGSQTQTLALPYGTYTITATALSGILPISVPFSLAAANGTKATVSGSTIMLDPRTATS